MQWNTKHESSLGSRDFLEVECNIYHPHDNNINQYLWFKMYHKYFKRILSKVVSFKFDLAERVEVEENRNTEERLFWVVRADCWKHHVRRHLRERLLYSFSLTSWGLEGTRGDKPWGKGQCLKHQSGESEKCSAHIKIPIKTGLVTACAQENPFIREGTTYSKYTHPRLTPRNWFKKCSSQSGLWHLFKTSGHLKWASRLRTTELNVSPLETVMLRSEF